MKMMDYLGRTLIAFLNGGMRTAANSLQAYGTFWVVL
jgi:hypothetical protein